MELGRRLTERRRQHFENEFQKKRKKERLGLIAGTIAHDFNNALVGILGNALLASGDPLTSQHSKQCISNIEDGVIKARALVYQALNFLGHDDGSSHGLSDVGAVLREAAGVVPQGPGVGARIKFGEVQNGLQAAIEPTKLAQLMVYIFLNAQEAIGGDAGVVEIKVLRRILLPRSRKKMLLCPDSLPNDVITIDVSDNGVGLAKGELARISDPFFRTKSKGRGLGLAAAGGIIRAHGGGLSVSSGMGKGTRVRVYLPRASNAASYGKLSLTQAVCEPESSETAPSRLLVIDDQKEFGDILATQLKSLGYSCTVAFDGAEGLRQVKEDPALKAALVDLTMPGMDGWQTLEALKSQRPDLPIVIMSGTTDTETARKVHDAGQGVYFLAKPFGREALDVLLAKVLAGEAN